MSRRDKSKRLWALVPLILLSGSLIWVYMTPLPAALASSPEQHVTVLARDGELLVSARTAEFQLHERIEATELGPYVAAALLAAEDRRFYDHVGVDPLAMVRAGLQALKAGRIVSGASTITQQLARATFDRPRSLWGKLQEIAIALRIERSWSKTEILTEYLNRISFGPNITGLAAASRHYFAKPVAHLSLAEVAALVSVPRGPSYYDPVRQAPRLKQRRDRVLERMQRFGLAAPAQVQAAQRQELTLRQAGVWKGAHHWVRKVLAEPGLAPVVHSTLDASLQREAETAVWRHVRRLERVNGSAAAALVVDNRTREILAYVGSPDYEHHPEGQNDGVWALRQPGSALKPFVYAAAMQELGFSAATTLWDVELTFRTEGGTYTPRNYDLVYHGPVPLRAALGNSLNVPAVYTAAQLGVGRLLQTLRSLGMASLSRDAEHYGVALALGDGEVRLAELAGAYTALANDGVFTPLRWHRAAPSGPPVAVFQPEIAQLITDILADPEARTSAFGYGNVLEFDFDVAAKTGTSKGHRDNWTAGFSSEVTVAVWVGNFDGTPMRGASGVTGAGPLFHELMTIAMRGRVPRPLRLARRTDLSPSLVSRRICQPSGRLPTAACPTVVEEWFRRGAEPAEPDDRFVVGWIDSDGALTGAECPNAHPEVFERYPSRLLPWARANGRPLLPTVHSATCPPEDLDDTELSIKYPHPGATFEHSPLVSPDRQQLVFEVGSDAPRVHYTLNGRPLGSTAPPHRLAWSTTPGDFTLRVTAQGEASEVRFSVDRAGDDGKRAYSYVSE